MVEVPVLKTERLRLRGHQLEDFAACAGMWADPVVTQHIGGRPLAEDESWTRLLRVAPWPKDAPEIGWVFVTQSHGKGYATEAVRAAVAWGDEHFGARQTGCIIRPENLASIRVAEKSGYRKFQDTTYKGQPTLVFVR